VFSNHGVITVVCLTRGDIQVLKSRQPGDLSEICHLEGLQLPDHVFVINNILFLITGRDKVISKVGSVFQIHHSSQHLALLIAGAG